MRLFSTVRLSIIQNLGNMYIKKEYIFLTNFQVILMSLAQGTYFENHCHKSYLPDFLNLRTIKTCINWTPEGTIYYPVNSTVQLASQWY